MVRLFFHTLGGCSGCEVVLTELGEGFLGLFAGAEVRHFPLLMDHKLGDLEEPDLPEVDIALVSGAVLHEGHRYLLEALRRKTRHLVAVGTCATHGGLPAFLNLWPKGKLLEEVYAGTFGTSSESLWEDLPPPLERVCAVDEVVAVDLLLPGCAPHPTTLAEALKALMLGEEVKRPWKSVCETCPTIRKGKGEVRDLRRFLELPEYAPDTPLEETRCFLEQGFLCLGPVTAAGCAGEGPPRCIAARVPCRGCFGPVRPEGHQMLEMLNALVSNGINWRALPDRRALLCFSGAHGRLRPVRG